MPTASRIVVPVLVGVLALCVGGAYYTFRQAFPDPPDITKVASSTAVVEADRKATATLDDRLAEVLAVVGSAQSTAVTDVCGIHSSGAVFGPSAAECDRAVTAYLGANDAPADDGWDQSLRKAGWYRNSDDPQQPIQYLKTAGVNVDITWMRLPATPAPLRQAWDYTSPVYREQRTVDASTFYPRYGYVVMVTTQDQYYPVPPPPSPPPSPNDHACYSGSGTCIGG